VAKWPPHLNLISSHVSSLSFLQISVRCGAPCQVDWRECVIILPLENKRKYLQNNPPQLETINVAFVLRRMTFSFCDTRQPTTGNGGNFEPSTFTNKC